MRVRDYPLVPPGTLFYTLADGQVFRHAGGKMLLMKVAAHGRRGENRNAVYLHNGSLVQVDVREDVVRIDGEFVVGEK